MNQSPQHVVDDSAVVRQVLNPAPGIEACCAVANPLMAIERLKMRWPDVIVLDVEMPRMDGRAKTTMEALAAGAVSLITKTKLGLKQFIVDTSDDLVSAVKAASKANVRRLAIRAQHNDRVVPGQALIAPGGKHMVLKRSGAQYFVEVLDGPLVNRHRPSVDVLFRSVAKSAGANALGLIMTGMLERKNAGARTIAQDEETCVVYGMPKEAVKRGAVDKILPIGALHREIIQHGS